MHGGRFSNLVDASLPLIFDQMCSGMIGTHICKIVALGLSQVNTTVKSSLAATLVMPFV